MSFVDTHELPTFLKSYADLKEHFDNALEGLTSQEKGRKFVKFVLSLIPMTEWADFQDLELHQETYDEGVDISGKTVDGQRELRIQSKLTVRNVQEVASIISRFEDYHTNHYITSPIQAELFSGASKYKAKTDPEQCFMIVTLSKITEKIIPLFASTNHSSIPFYKKLNGSNRLAIIDGLAILNLLQNAYRKSFVLPTNVSIKLDSRPLTKDNVYVGIVSSSELRKCYSQFGEALFLQDIRNFLGMNKNSVNAAIADTANNEPMKMLARNNGITFKAERVQFENEITLILDNASIVNGCQTTVCISQSQESDSFVLIKIVETSDSWDIAKSSNFQNRVEQIELELAQFIRPQLIKQAAVNAGFGLSVNTQTSVFNVIDVIYQDRVTYDSIRYLFIGFLSKNPNNILVKLYTELRYEVLNYLDFGSNEAQEILETLLQLQKVANSAIGKVRERYSNKQYKDLFKRFTRGDKPDYQAYLTILASCGCVQDNIFQDQFTLADFLTFMRKLNAILIADEGMFDKYYSYAFESIASFILNIGKDRNDILKNTYDWIRRARFDNVYQHLLVIADGRRP